MIPADASLADLGNVLLVAFDWEGYRMQQFELGNRREGGRTFRPRESRFDDGDDGCEDAELVAVGDIIGTKGDTLLWRYDFGDDWEHRIVCEGAVEAADRLVHCKSGRRAAPPEDCGGVYGYYGLLDILADPTHEEHAEMLEWTGGPIDPEEFSAGELERVLASIPIEGVEDYGERMGWPPGATRPPR